jgi:acyl-coenzyme A thioesterase PaaI-like protein
VFAKLGTTGVTSKMEIKLSKPMLMSKGPVKLTARLREMHRNIALIDVELMDGEGTRCAEGVFHYFTYPENVAKEMLSYPGREKFR